MRFSLKSPKEQDLYVAGKQGKAILWSDKVEDACSFSCISKALKLALDIRKETGQMPQVISTYF